MALVPAKCTECGASIEVDASKEAGICSHCGTAFITEKVINNFTTNYNTVHNITNNVTKIINGKEKDDGEDFFNRGLTNLKLKKFESARVNFDKAITKNPEIAKYYFYWCYAASEGLKDCRVFFKEIAPSFWRTEEQEEDNSIEAFFELASDEEKEELTNGYGLDLTNGLSGLKVNLLNKLFDSNEIMVKIPGHSRDTLFSSLTEEEKSQIKESAHNFFFRNAENTQMKKNDFMYLLKSCIKNNAYPNADLFLPYINDEEILTEIIKGGTAEEILEKRQQIVEKLEQEKRAKERANQKVANRSISIVYSGVVLFVSFIVTYFVISFRMHETGSGNIVTGPFWPAVGISVACTVVAFAAMQIYFYIRSKNKK